MFSRKGLAAVASAVLACGSVVNAADDLSAGGSGLTLQQPLYAQAAAPRKPLMSALDKMGAAKPLDDAGINVGGWVEVSWTHNFGDPAGDINNGRVFDFEHNDPTFNQAVIFIEKAVAPSGTNFDIGGRVEFMWGGDARLIHSSGILANNGVDNGPDEQCDLTQAYAQVNIPVGNGLVLTAGKFVTPLGAETINPTTNWLYSHSFLFGYAIPFTNTGVTAKYWFSPECTVMVGVIHGWEMSNGDNNNSHTYLAQVGHTSEKYDVYLNLITGPEQDENEQDWRSVIDLVFVYRAADNLTLMLNADYGWEDGAGDDGDDAHWCGVAGYAKYKVSDMFSVVGRLEYFNDQDGARGIGATAYEATLGLNITPLPNDELGSNLVIRPEIRYDWSNDEIFDGADDDQQVTFGVDAIFMF